METTGQIDGDRPRARPVRGPGGGNRRRSLHRRFFSWRRGNLFSRSLGQRALWVNYVFVSSS
jgi:hypothetical protein